MYAPRDRAREITEEVIGLYLKIVDDLNFKMEYVLYSVLTFMIDAYFDDMDEFRRLTKMLDNGTSQESVVAFESQQRTLESLKFSEEKLARAEENLVVAEEGWAETKEDLAVTKGDLVETREELVETKGDLVEANARIATLEAEVRRLTDQLNAK